MPTTTNKIRYGLKNVYVAKATVSETNVVSYGTPVAIPGAVSLSLDTEGDVNPFYADNIVYYRSVNNNGYSGTTSRRLTRSTRCTSLCCSSLRVIRRPSGT